MSQKNLEEIAAAILLGFGDTSSSPRQQPVRPYFVQPAQAALKVLDCCCDRQPTNINAICVLLTHQADSQTLFTPDDGSLANLNQATPRQILKSLKARGLEIESARGWQRLTPTTSEIPAEAEFISNPAFKQAVAQSFGQRY